MIFFTFLFMSQSKIYIADRERKLTEFRKSSTDILEILSPKEVAIVKKMFEKLKRDIYFDMSGNRFICISFMT